MSKPMVAEAMAAAAEEEAVGISVEVAAEEAILAVASILAAEEARAEVIISAVPVREAPNIITPADPCRLPETTTAATIAALKT